jgi:hypothetical protein
MLLRIMNPFQQCHLVMLRSLYEYEPISSDDVDPIEIEISSMLWNRISFFLQKRKALQDTTERLKDIQDSLMEVKLLNQPLEEELSSFLAKVEKQQRFHGYGHLRTCGGSVDEDEKGTASKVTACNLIHATLAGKYNTLKQIFLEAIEPFVELEDVVQKELFSLRSEQSSVTSEEQDFGFICNKIYLWERLLFDMRQIIHIGEYSDIDPRQKPMLAGGIIV